jgi:hypothetical protein
MLNFVPVVVKEVRKEEGGERKKAGKRRERGERQRKGKRKKKGEGLDGREG